MTPAVAAEVFEEPSIKTAVETKATEDFLLLLSLRPIEWPEALNS